MGVVVIASFFWVKKTELSTVKAKREKQTLLKELEMKGMSHMCFAAPKISHTIVMKPYQVYPNQCQWLVRMYCLL